MVATQRLPELLSSLAEAPDLAAAGEFLLEQVGEVRRRRRGRALVIDGEQLVEVARSGAERNGTPRLTLATDEPAIRS